MKKTITNREPASSLVTPAFSKGERWAWWGALFLASLLLASLQMTTTGTFKLASLERLIHFQANEPFQCRALIPAIAAAVQHLAPLRTKVIFGAIELVFWMSLVFLAYRALDYFRIGGSDLIRRLLAFTVIVPMVMHLLVPDLNIGASVEIAGGLLDAGTWYTWPLFYYPYDLPGAVFTLALCLLLMRLREQPEQGAIIGFTAVFALATLNRETTVFLLLPTVLLLWGRLGLSRAVLLGLALLAVFLSIEVPLHWLFDALPNPNRRVAYTPYENHLVENLGFLKSPFYDAWLTTRFAGGLGLVVLFWWRFVDRPLQILLLGFALPLILSAMLVGRLSEHRIFTETVPLIWLSAMYAIAARSGHHDTPHAGRDLDPTRNRR